MENKPTKRIHHGIPQAATAKDKVDPVFLEKEKHRIDILRKKLWGKDSVKLPPIKRNPVAKALLQGDGQYAGKVIQGKEAKRDTKPKFGKQEWLKELDDQDNND